MEKEKEMTAGAVQEAGTEEAVSLSDLSEKGCCQRGRNFKAVFGGLSDKTQGSAYYRNRVLIDTIVNSLLYDRRKKEDYFKYMDTRYPEIGYENEIQYRVNLGWDKFYVDRYIRSEKRKGVYAPPVLVEIKGKKVLVKASIMFVTGQGDDREAELVIYKTGKSTSMPTFSRDLQLYAMLLAGRQMGFKKVKASFYHLVKSSDGMARRACDPGFFGGDNVITMEYQDEPDAKTKKRIESLENSLSEGIHCDDMDEDSCTYCPYIQVCRYKEAPKPVEEEEEKAGQVPKKTFPLSQAQQAIIDAVMNSNGNIVVVNAGAGSGKTATITRAVAELVNAGGQDPETILMITFTDSACKEMRKRLKELLGAKADGVRICTFNSLGNEILISNWKFFGFKREPKLISDPERYDLIKREVLDKHPIREWTGQSIKNLDKSSRNSRYKPALELMSEIYDYVRSSGLPCTAIQACDVDHIVGNADISSLAVRKIIDLYPVYDKLLMERGLYNYTDQLRMTLEFLESDPGYLEREYGTRYFFIDEFQDTSAEQIDLVNDFMRSDKITSLTLVGDDDQAIYGSFRNTSMEYIQKPEDYIYCPSGCVVKINLLDNYRCAGNVIDTANRVIQKNKHRTVKLLNATRPAGAPVTAHGFYKKPEEYEYIVHKVKQLVDSGERPEDIAVLTYTKSELLELTSLLTKEGVPVMYAAPEPLIENSRILAVIDFVKLLGNPESIKCAVTAANAVMNGGFMDLDKDEMDLQIMKIMTLAKQINEKETLEEKKALLFAFIDSVTHGDEAVEYFKTQLQLKEFDEIADYIIKFERYGEKEEYRRLKNYPGVCMTTAHSAKGREWKHVFVSLSKFASIRKGNFEEEKRRLLFVSLTRAKDHLYVTSQYAASGSTKENRKTNKFICEVFDALGQNYNIDFDAYDEFIKNQRKAQKTAAAGKAKTGTAKRTVKKTANKTAG